jgi:hypothetical protein
MTDLTAAKAPQPGDTANTDPGDLKTLIDVVRLLPRTGHLVCDVVAKPLVLRWACYVRQVVLKSDINYAGTSSSLLDSSNAVNSFSFQTIIDNLGTLITGGSR